MWSAIVLTCVDATSTQRPHNTRTIVTTNSRRLGPNPQRDCQEGFYVEGYFYAEFGIEEAPPETVVFDCCVRDAEMEPIRSGGVGDAEMTPMKSGGVRDGLAAACV